MSGKYVLKTQLREKEGTRASAKLRKQGFIPAVVYGHKEKTESIAVSFEEFTLALRKHATDFQLEHAGKSEGVLIQHIQHCHLNKDILHIDFRRVSDTDVIQLDVPIELKGDAVGLRTGGVMIQPLHTLHIECLAKDRPEVIRVKIDDLAVGQAIHVKEIALPTGVKALNDGEAVVVQIKVPGVSTEVAAEGAAEPEIITAKKKADDAAE